MCTQEGKVNRPFSTPGSTGLYCPQVDSLVSHWWNERQNYKYAVFYFSTHSTQQVSTLKCQCHLEWDWSVLIWVSIDSIQWYYSQKWVVSTLSQNYGTYIRPGKLHLSFHIGARIRPNLSPQLAILYFSCSRVVLKPGTERKGTERTEQSFFVAETKIEPSVHRPM